MVNIGKYSSTAALALISMAAYGSPAYKVMQQWPAGDMTRYDYVEVDPVRHRLYVSNGDRVQVWDLAAGKQSGVINGTPGVHGIALAQDLKLGFTSNGRANSITVFDLDTLQVKQELKIAGQNPDAILYEPGSHKLYTFNGKSSDVSVVDARSLRQVATIKVSGKPEFAATDGKGHVFVNIEDKAEVAVIDVAGDKVSGSWKLAGCEEPTGLALDTARSRLYSVCQNKVMLVLDSQNGKAVAHVPIGEHPDAVIADGANVLVSNGGGTLDVVKVGDKDSYSVQSSVPTAKGARTMALDPASRSLYLPTVINKVFTVLVVAPGP